MTSLLAVCLALVAVSAQASPQTGKPTSFTIPKIPKIPNPTTTDDPSIGLPAAPDKSTPLGTEFRQESVKGIQQRIDTLKEILEKRRAAAATAAQQAETTATEPAKPTTEPLGSQNRSSAESSRNLDLDPTGTSSTEPIDEDASDPPTLENPDLTGIPVITSPINSMELANSLYLTQNYTAALKTYEALLSTETDQLDQDWLRCLAANCYRIQGQASTAEVLYREVAGSKQQSYPSDHSKWYLNHLTKRKDFQARLLQIEAEIDTYSQQGK